MTSTEISSNVNTNSRPSELKITDMRLNSDEDRRSDSQVRHKSGDLRTRRSARRSQQKHTHCCSKVGYWGENPCNVDKIFRQIQQFGHHARQGGGVCGIEMALMDLAGKAYGVPLLPTPRAGSSVTRFAAMLTHHRLKIPKRWEKNSKKRNGSWVYLLEDGRWYWTR